MLLAKSAACLALQTLSQAIMSVNGMWDHVNHGCGDLAGHHASGSDDELGQHSSKECVGTQLSALYCRTPIYLLVKTVREPT